jgi:hypothetical protein
MESTRFSSVTALNLNPMTRITGLAGSIIAEPAEPVPHLVFR